LLALAFLTGIGLAHLVTVLFIVPPLLWFILSRRPDLLRRPRLMAQAVGLILLPLISYVYVYVRGAQHPEWRGAGQWENTWQWFWAFLSTRQGRDELTWSLLPLWTDEFPALVWRELTWPVLLVGLWGVSRLGHRRALLIYGTLVIYLVVCFIDRLGNWYQVIMPAYPLIVLGMAIGASHSGRRGSASVPARGATTEGSPLRRMLIVLALCGLVVYRFALSLPRADSAGRPEDVGLNPGWAIIADDPPAGAAIIGTRDELLALDYLTQVWEVRPDLQPVGAPQAREALATGRLLLSTVGAVPIVQQEVAADTRFASAGVMLVEVRTGPQRDIPKLEMSLNVPVGDGLALLGVSRWQPAVHPALPRQFYPSTLLSLYWRATGPISHDWAISLRPTRGGVFIYTGDQLVQTDRAHPVQGTYPTTRWEPGEVVRDDYNVPMPPDQPVDGLAVIVYRPLLEGGFQNLAELHIPIALQSGLNEP